MPAFRAVGAGALRGPGIARKDPIHVVAAFVVDGGFDDVVGMRPDGRDRTVLEIVAPELLRGGGKRVELSHQGLNSLRSANTANGGVAGSGRHRGSIRVACDGVKGRGGIARVESGLRDLECLAGAGRFGSDYAALGMVVDQAHGLHKGEYRGGADELPTALFEVF